jgi:hypothetical protein
MMLLEPEPTLSKSSSKTDQFCSDTPMEPLHQSLIAWSLCDVTPKLGAVG